MTSNTNKKYKKSQTLVFTVYAMLMLLTTQKPRYIYYVSPKVTKIFTVSNPRLWTFFSISDSN
jgi:hypothetical protein